MLGNCVIIVHADQTIIAFCEVDCGYLCQFSFVFWGSKLTDGL